MRLRSLAALVTATLLAGCMVVVDEHGNLVPVAGTGAGVPAASAPPGGTAISTVASTAPASPAGSSLPASSAPTAPRPTPTAAGWAKPEIQAALDVLNAARAHAHLDPVSLDMAMSQACEAHANYLALNAGSPAVEGLKAHQEDESLPGYTPGGKKAGQNSDISWGQKPARAIAGLVGTLYHRTPIMVPEAQKVGIGSLTDAKGTIITVVMFDWGGDAPRRPEAYPVAYPADGQTDVPLAFGGEFPDPVPAGGGAAGYPITLNFSGQGPQGDVQATMTDANGNAVPVYLSTPAKPATSFPQGGAICLIPQHPLAPATTYKVSVAATQDDQPHTWTWSFTTVAPTVLAASDGPGLERALADGTLVKVTGTVKYTFDQGFLGLAVGDASGHMLWFILGGDAYQAFQAAGHTAKEYEGKQVTALGTLSSGSGTDINLDVASPDDLAAR